MQPKRWGPFTGRQLTTIIVAVLLAIAGPIAANATATGDEVVITDPTIERYAKVDQFGNLRVGDNKLKVDLFGNLKVAPQYGTVTARSADLNDTFHGITFATDTRTPLLTTGARAAVITSIHVSVTPNTSDPEQKVRTTLYGPGGSCAAGPSLESVGTQGADTIVLTYDPGILVPPSSYVCMLSSLASVQPQLSVWGYFLDD